MTPDENERLCRVGPRTPAGALLRRYWLPAIESARLPTAGGAPVRLRMLGEDLVAFRGRDGTVGVLEEYCPHRRASLALGRVVGCTLQCIYHGWRMGTDGAVVEAPNAPNLRLEINTRSCRVRESAGLIWIYMGPPETEPVFRDYVWTGFGLESRQVYSVVTPTNYLQAIEGALDPSHVEILHQTELSHLKLGAPPAHLIQATEWKDTILTRPVRYEAADTSVGFDLATFTPLKGPVPAQFRVRIFAIVFPFIVMTPPRGSAFIAVPIDDTRTRLFGVEFGPEITDGPLRPPMLMGGHARRDEALDLPVQDRVRMAAEGPGSSFSGIDGITAQDILVQTSQGALYDRQGEHLVPADMSIVRYRRLLAAQIKILERGGTPIGLGPGIDLSAFDATAGTVNEHEPWEHLYPHRRHRLDCA